MSIKYKSVEELLESAREARRASGYCKMIDRFLFDEEANILGR